MKTLVYSAKKFEIPFLKKANEGLCELHFIEDRLHTHSANKAVGFEAVSIFSADDASVNVLEKLYDFGVRYITLRSAGYDNVNIKKATSLGIQVAHAPKYSPHAIAEHAVGLLQAINRKIVLAHRQMQDHDFTLDNLVGQDLIRKKVGIVGTGKIGAVIARIMHGFGCILTAVDPNENPELKSAYDLSYMTFDDLCRSSDIVFLSLPLSSQTHHLINSESLKNMAATTILVNVARGGLVCTTSLLERLDQDLLGGYATDVYEKEKGIFSYDLSDTPPKEAALEALLKHPKVVLTPHQAYATHEALTNIAMATIENLSAWDRKLMAPNALNTIASSKV
ncbi:MAG: NAD(P)-dependent oxidoreductase [Dokdonia sp.]|jgi:D-lactate dehydrogenase